MLEQFPILGGFVTANLSGGFMPNDSLDGTEFDMPSDQNDSGNNKVIKTLGLAAIGLVIAGLSLAIGLAITDHQTAQLYNQHTRAA